MRVAIGLGALLILVPAAGAATLTVGPGKTYSAPCAAFGDAQPGDTVEIDASGDYAGDVCAFDVDDLTIRGVGGGRAKVDATGVTIPNGKAIWVISGDHNTVENIEFMGAEVADANGAGIRGQAPNLTIRNCYFHDNQDGILTGEDADGGEIRIEGSEFGHNGAGDGQSHNMYIGATGLFVLMNSYSHDPVGGHEVKTRARENHILYNRLMDEATGEGSYQIDLAQSGTSYIIGNLIEKGPASQNHSQLIRDECQGGCSPGHDLYVINNTFVNDEAHANASTYVYLVLTGASALPSPPPAVIRNNLFVGGGTVTNQTTALADHNFEGDPLLADQAGYDYHLLAGSPAIDQGIAPGSSTEGFDLTAVAEYVHPAASEPRSIAGSGIDLGAYEFGNDPNAGSSSSSGSTGGSASGSTGSGSTGGSSGGSTSGASSGSTGSGSASGSSGTSSGGAAETSGCGCDTSGGPLGASFVLLLTGLAFGARRRRAG